jgi:hypothetical protein
VGTPYRAILDGVSYLVCERQILDQETPELMVAQAQLINREVNRGLEERDRLLARAT